jgi:hypothetical protein
MGALRFLHTRGGTELPQGRELGIEPMVKPLTSALNVLHQRGQLIGKKVS